MRRRWCVLVNQIFNAFMIITELLDQERRAVRPILDAVFELALENQAHPQDLFLLANLGYYDKKLENNDLGLSKYVLGLPGESGLEYFAAYEFINEFRQQVRVDMHDVEELKNSIKDDAIKKEAATRDELIGIQVEQLVYLKFWESNFIIRQFYQVARLISGEGYDWDFDTINKSRKRILVDQVRNRIEPFSKPFASLFDSCYKSQIRNAIAHSLFYTIGDTLIFTNYGHNLNDSISKLSFVDWRPYIHKTLVIFDEMIRIRQFINKYYSDQARKNENKLEFRLKTKTHDEIRTVEHFPGEMNQWGNIQMRR